MPDLTSLAERLKQIRVQYPDADPPMVADVVRAVLSSMTGDLSSAEGSLLSQVAELRRTINTAKAEISALSVDEITDNHIPSATDELDAIVKHTAAATDAILEACEALDKMAGEIGGTTAAALQDATTRIYEACSFQDITGQRISKIVATLKMIDDRVGEMVNSFGPRGARIPAPAASLQTEAEKLLNGPQLAANAMAQGDIDSLLASFD